MWWRALGVAVVLLCAGVAGGYAVADRSQEEPVAQRHARSRSRPSPRRCPRLRRRPTCPTRTAAPLAARPAQPPEDLRISRRGAGGHGRHPRRLAAEPGLRARTCGTSSSRATRSTPTSCGSTLTIGQNVSISRRQGRAGSRRWRSPTPDGRGNMQDFTVTAETDDTFEATYIVRRLPARDHGEVGRLRRQPRLRRRSSVTGRTVDEEGLRDLLDRTVDSMQPLEALPPKSPKAADRRSRCRGCRRRRGPGWRWRGRRCGPAPTAACWR